MVNETNASATMTSNERTARAMRHGGQCDDGVSGSTSIFDGDTIYKGRRSFVTDLLTCSHGHAHRGGLSSSGPPDRAPVVAVSVVVTNS